MPKKLKTFMFLFIFILEDIINSNIQLPMKNGKRIIVSMTSWTKRIENVSTVISSIMKQTVPPDLVELNLSIEEFPNKLEALPIELQNLVKENECIEINWCEGNDNVFKKIIPTLKKFYGEEYYLISIDDDMIYGERFIEENIKEIDIRGVDAFNFSKSVLYGNRQIYLSSAFKEDYWECVSPEIIRTKHDDLYTLIYFTKRGKTHENLELDEKEARELYYEYNAILPNSENGYPKDVYKVMDKYLK